MNKENCFDSIRKQSFKAVENFLRRVSYNLGNSPSLTEVKIVSCIPIDVTDLQNKIVELETKLAALKASKTSKTNSDCNCTKPNDTGTWRACCDECLLASSSDHSGAAMECNSFSATSVRPSPVQKLNNPNTKACNTQKNCSKKKRKKAVNPKTQLLYFANTDINSPFHKNDVLTRALSESVLNPEHFLTTSYFTDIVQRQYRHRPYLRDSELSDISTPICTDIRFVPPSHASDACSCLHGQFQNVDYYMTCRNQPLQHPGENGPYQRDSYYDSNLYDVVPVKDKAFKKANKEKMNEHNKRRHDTKLMKHRNAPTVVNYCALSHRKEYNKLHPIVLKKDNEVEVRITDKLKSSTPRQIKNDIVYSTVYSKRDARKRHTNTSNVPTKHLQDAATSPPDENTTSHRTATTITESFTSEVSTEKTLNQIKDILQSVLTEVKTNAKVTNPPLQKNDAAVQNASAPAAPLPGYGYGSSRLLQTYTYSPHNLNPYNMSASPYKLPYAHQIPGNYAHIYPALPAMPLPQYPLMVPPHKHLGNSFYKHKPVPRRATSAATNTEQVKEHSRETERLIKEIYKSLAANMEESSKDNSVLEYMKAKSITDKYINLTKTESETESEIVAKAISEIFKNTNVQDSTATGTTADSKNKYSHHDSVAESLVNKGPRVEKVYTHRETTEYPNETNNRKPCHSSHGVVKESSDNCGVIEQSEESSSGTSESEDTVEAKKIQTVTETTKTIKPTKLVKQKKEKNGLFKKMLTFLLPAPRQQRDNTHRITDKDSTSEDDDYRTVCSQTVPKPKISIIRRPHSKVFYVKQANQWSRTRSPDKCTRDSAYSNNKDKSVKWCRTYDDEVSADPRSYKMSRGTVVREYRNPHVYHREYETRPVFIHHRHKQHRKSANERYTNTRNDANTGKNGKSNFVASKTKRGFVKGWLKKTNCGQCAQNWKQLILNS